MALHGHYNWWLVALSYAIACAGSYLALRMAGKALHGAHDDPAAPFTAIAPAAVTLGLTIWIMHFTGMAAFHIDGTAITYRFDLTALSLLVAVAFTGFGFATLVLSRDYRESFALAGLPMGCGILTMHFLGMAAMTGDMEQHYQPGWVIAAGIIALGASVAALWLTMQPRKSLHGGMAALAMGAAICGMHYTGMHAAEFSTPLASAE